MSDLPIPLMQSNDHQLIVPRRGYEPDSVYHISWSRINSYGVLTKVLTVSDGIHRASEIAKYFESTKTNERWHYGWTNDFGSLILASEEYDFAWQCVYLKDMHAPEIANFIRIS